ncbi:MAG: rRNA maturation RNase YbeY [Chloroflexia bacterium]|nr:rRNA maturation RNase YbeY [Chloroflexia bacterium]
MLKILFAGNEPRAAAHLCDIETVLMESFPLIDNRPEGEWSVTVLLTGSEEISHLHGRFFGDASDTDVMSFPSGDDPHDDGGYLGDIAISLDVATAQAQLERHSLGRELSYLALHGLLHLLGYRDEDEMERAAMLEFQDALFAAWKHKMAGLD